MYIHIYICVYTCVYTYVCICILDSLNSWRSSFWKNWNKSNSVKCKRAESESVSKNYRQAGFIKYKRLQRIENCINETSYKKQTWIRLLQSLRGLRNRVSPLHVQVHNPKRFACPLREASGDRMVGRKSDILGQLWFSNS